MHAQTTEMTWIQTEQNVYFRIKGADWLMGSLLSSVLFNPLKAILQLESNYPSFICEETK